VTQARAQITEVNVSGPNFSGTRVSTGMKYKSAATGRISVFLFFALAQVSHVS
jgi:hypothetical protein